MEAENKGFTYSEVVAHNTCQDCWVIINAKVYNVTSYLNEHPGGDEVLLKQAGKDASEEFEDVGHGSAARLMLDEFYVGEVVDPSMERTKDMSMERTKDMSNTPTADINIKDKPFHSANKFFYFLMVLVIVGLGVGIHLLLHRSVN